LDSQLDHYKQSYGLILDPDFQRGYVWNMNQRSMFMEYLIRGGKVFSPIIFNSPAFMGREGKTDMGEELIIVDGLQRLTTCMMFLKNEVPVFGDYCLNDFDNPRLLTMRIGLKFAINSLKTRKELLLFYVQLNEGHVAHSKEEIDRVKELLHKA
jgi:uncharacterized protein with ParB-like and HNH nuclease domain